MAATRIAHIQPRGTEANPYYCVVAANGEVLTTSEMYSSRSARDRAIGDMMAAMLQIVGSVLAQGTVEHATPDADTGTIGLVNPDPDLDIPVGDD